MGEEQYQIVITSWAEQAYFEVLNYVFDHYTFERANQIALDLLECPQVLKANPLLGRIEPNLVDRTENYRFIIFKRTTKTTVKIIYYVDEFNQKIYLTDFFPCEMNLQKLKQKNDL